MKSLIFKRSIMVAGHKTSVSLEDAFWNALKEIARERHMRLSELVAKIDAQRQLSNLSSALRLFVLEFYRTQLSDTQILLECIISGDAPDFVEVGEAGIAVDDAMRRQRRVQLVG